MIWSFIYILYAGHLNKCKDSAISEQALRFPYFKTDGFKGGKVVSPMH
jgi:hypothetical protein